MLHNEINITHAPSERVTPTARRPTPSSPVLALKPSSDVAAAALAAASAAPAAGAAGAAAAAGAAVRRPA